MKQRTIIIIVLFALVAAGVGIGWYRTVRPGAQTRSPKPVLPDGVRVALEGKTRITSTEHEALAWTMTTDGLNFFEERGVVEVDGPRAWIPAKDGGTIEVSGLAGRYFQSSQDREIEKGVRVSFQKGGRDEWIINGDTASYRRSEDKFHISSISGTVSLESGETVSINGGSGLYDTGKRMMRIEKDVVCVWSKGMTLKTDSLDYSPETGAATTDDAVDIQGLNYRLKGRGLRADMNGKKVVVPADVKLRIEPKKGAKK